MRLPSAVSPVFAHCPASLLAVAMPASAKLTVMHGYADYTSALLWVMAEAPGPIEISWQRGRDRPGTQAELTRAPQPGKSSSRA